MKPLIFNRHRIGSVLAVRVNRIRPIAAVRLRLIKGRRDRLIYSRSAQVRRISAGAE